MSVRPLITQQLVGEANLTTFLREDFGVRPRVFGGTAHAFIPLGDWAAVSRLVEETRCDRVVVRDGGAHPGPAPTRMDEARALFAEGCSVMLRGVDLWDQALGDFGRRLAMELQGRLNLHVYATPQSRGSFGWHHDPEDVFIVQTKGRKRYTLRENTVFPNPVLDRMGTRAELAREKTAPLEVALAEGDVLYIPPGCWHTTLALEDSLSISVGLLRLSYLDVLDLLRAQLLEVPEARTRLPPLGLVSAVDDPQKLPALRGELEEVAKVVRKALLHPGFLPRLVIATAGRAPHAAPGPQAQTGGKNPAEG